MRPSKACCRTSGRVRTAPSDRAVEEDRDVEVLADPLGRVVAELERASRRLGVQRHEGDDVDDPESRVHALVGSQIQGVEGGGDERAHVVDQWLGIVDEGEDRTIVGRVGVQVAQGGTARYVEFVEESRGCDPRRC